MTAALLEAVDLAVGHGRHVVANGLNLALRPGRVLCLLGPNGGGKTTLLRTLLGLIPPLAGRVLLDGTAMHRLARSAVARRVAYVPQAVSGGFAFQVREVVAMGRAAHLPLLASPGQREHDAAEAALIRLGIAHLAEQPVTAISGGERQLVLIARALVQEAAALVMDEPTASLDFGNQALVLQQVRDLAEEDGLAILMTTHQPDHALLIAHEAAMLHQGRFTAGPAPPTEVVTAERLREAYGVEAVVRTLATPYGSRHVCVPLLR